MLGRLADLVESVTADFEGYDYARVLERTESFFWGFCDDYLEMVRAYAAHYGLPIADEALTREALAWAIGRGARSGRVAFQFIRDLAGRLGVRLDGD